jgi:hypothetical protein
VRAIGALSLAIVLCVSAEARARDPVVAVVHGPDDAALARRIGAELEALEISARLVPTEAGEPTADLERLAAGAGVDAALRAEAASGRVEVWAGDPSSEQVVYRNVVMSIEGEGAEEEVALGAVELLRASLLEVSAASARAPADEPSTPARREPESTQPPAEEAEPGGVLTLELGPAVTGVSLGTAPTVNVFIGVHLRAISLLGVEVLGVTPMVPATIEEQAGEVKVHFGLAGGGLRLSFSDPQGRWLPCASLGVAAAFFQLTSRTDRPFVGHDELVVAPAPYGRVGLAFEVHERVRVRADLLVGWTLPGTVLRIAEREVATLGTPLLAGALGVEVVLF